MEQEVNNETNTTVSQETPITPVEPAVPEQPVAPVVPEQPVAPVAPEQPVAPVVPEQPVAPVAPVAPAVDPMMSVNPAATPVGGMVADTAVKAGGFKLGVGFIIAIVAIVSVLVGGIVFKVISSQPKNVFKTAITGIYKDVKTGLKETKDKRNVLSFSDGKMYASLDLKVDTNLEEIEELEDELGIKLSDYKIKGEFGVDAKETKALVGAALEGKTSLDVKVFFDDGKAYIGSSLLDEPLYLGESEDFEIDLSDFEDLFEELESVPTMSDEDIEYLTKAVTDALVKSLDTSKMEKETDKVKVNGKEISVTKYTYKVDGKILKNTVETVLKELKSDKKFVKIIQNYVDEVAKIADEDAPDVEETLDEAYKSVKDSEIEKDAVDFKINLYTNGLLNSIIGYGIKAEGMEFSVIQNKKVAEMKIEVADNTLSIVSEEKGKNKYTAEVKLNKEKIMTIDANELTDEVMDFSFTIHCKNFAEKVSELMDAMYMYDSDVEDMLEMLEELEDIKGEVYFSEKIDGSSIAGDYRFKVEYDGKYGEVSGSYKVSTKEGVSMDTKDAVDINELTDEEATEILEKIEEKLKEEEELYDLFMEYVEENMDNNPAENPTVVGKTIVDYKNADGTVTASVEYDPTYNEYSIDFEDSSNSISFFYVELDYNEDTKVATFEDTFYSISGKVTFEEGQIVVNFEECEKCGNTLSYTLIEE